MNNKMHLYHSNHLGNFKVFKEFLAQKRKKKYIFLIINHSLMISYLLSTYTV